MRTSVKSRNLSSKAEVVNVLEVSLVSVQSIFKDILYVHQIASKPWAPLCWVRRRGELCQHMPGPSREAWNLEFYWMVITGDETVVWVWPKSQVTVISVEEPIIFHAHEKGTFARMRWACSLVFWNSRSCTLWICSTRTGFKQYYYTDTLQYLKEVYGKNDLKIGIRGLVSWSWKMHVLWFVCDWISAYKQSDCH